jgi:hypothetical protein
VDTASQQTNGAPAALDPEAEAIVQAITNQILKGLK